MFLDNTIIFILYISFYIQHLIFSLKDIYDDFILNFFLFFINHYDYIL